jgi:hypothetical protein
MIDSPGRGGISVAHDVSLGIVASTDNKALEEGDII